MATVVSHATANVSLLTEVTYCNFKCAEAAIFYHLVAQLTPFSLLLATFLVCVILFKLF